MSERKILPRGGRAENPRYDVGSVGTSSVRRSLFYILFAFIEDQNVVEDGFFVPSRGHKSRVD